MTFSYNVKKELFEYYDSSRHCALAELAALINCNGSLFEKSFEIHSENKYVAEKFCNLAEFLFGIRFDIIDENKSYSIRIDEDNSKKILSSTGLISDGTARKHINGAVISSVCCKRAYIRGVFLCTGSLSNPEKNYHLEFVEYDREQAEELKRIINFFINDAKVTERKNQFVVYIKEGEQIVDLLNVMNAHKALMEFENVRIVKDVRNNINRIVNCETANLKKTVSASVKQREAIEYIRNRVGLEYLPVQLRETALLRLDYPDLSLKELGEMMTPAVGKSGINHRLKKIINIAAHLREDYL